MALQGRTLSRLLPFLTLLSGETGCFSDCWEGGYVVAALDCWRACVPSPSQGDPDSFRTGVFYPFLCPKKRH